MDGDVVQDTSQLLQQQLTNPRDIFTVLLILGGDVVQKAIAQLTGGPWKYFSPVTFSFGWASFAISSMLAAFGSNRLMPVPELDSLMINASSGYVRKNNSWLLARLLRDADYWVSRQLSTSLRSIESIKLSELHADQRKGLGPETVRIALRISVWRCVPRRATTGHDLLYWSGLLVTPVQILALGLPPLIYYNDYFTIMATCCGTALAWLTSALPQWREEKFGVRALDKHKDVLLTEGAGSTHLIVLRSPVHALDLEALAGGRSSLLHPVATRAICVLLALCWLMFLITVAGWAQNTWYILGVGLIGMIHNVFVAGWERLPAALGVPLEPEAYIVDGKVMKALWQLESRYPGAGLASVPVFFPGRLRSWEDIAWSFAKDRSVDWVARGRPLGAGDLPVAWRMPDARWFVDDAHPIDAFERQLPL